MVDGADSKSAVRKYMGVRVPPSAPNRINPNQRLLGTDFLLYKGRERCVKQNLPVASFVAPGMIAKRSESPLRHYVNRNKSRIGFSFCLQWNWTFVQWYSLREWYYYAMIFCLGKSYCSILYHYKQSE